MFAEETITFTAADVVDSVWIKRVLCTAKQPMEPETPTYAWTITRPSPDPPLTGTR